MQTIKYLIVGTGLTGATIAHVLRSRGNKVCCIEQRDEVGGNVADYRVDGTYIHKYGPHLFRTNSDRVWEFVNRFTTFLPYKHRVLTTSGGTIRPWPIKRSLPSFTGTPRNFEESALCQMGREEYSTWVKGYTEKQWGCEAVKLSPTLCKRFEKDDDSPYLHPHHKYQGVPTNGYSQLIEAMLLGVSVSLRTSYSGSSLRTIYTGPIDYFHRCRLGRLRYRSQRRDTVPGEPVYPQLNYADKSEPRIRTIGWRCITGGSSNLVTHETPQEGGLEYPFPDEENTRLYEEYKKLDTHNVLICGRLGEYRYYDMDQAIARALHICDSL